MTVSHLLGARKPAVVTPLLIALLGVVAGVAFAVSSPYFLSADNLSNLLTDLALTGIIAIPATFLIMSGHVDLSAGSIAAFTGIVVASAAPEWGLLNSVLLAIGAGAAIGVVNGLLVTAGGVDSIATTFTTMALVRGLAYLLPGGLAVALSGFRPLGNSRPFLGLSLPTLIFLALLAVGVMLSQSPAGERARAVGAMPTAGRLDQWKQRRLVILLFTISGLAAALVGLIRTSQLGTGIPTAAIGVEVVVLAAVLLGGGRFSGGHGSVTGTVLVLTVITIIDNGLSLANVTAYAGQVFHATLLLVAMVVDRVRRRKRLANQTKT